MFSGINDFFAIFASLLLSLFSVLLCCIELSEILYMLIPVEKLLPWKQRKRAFGDDQ